MPVGSSPCVWGTLGLSSPWNSTLDTALLRGTQFSSQPRAPQGWWVTRTERCVHLLSQTKNHVALQARNHGESSPLRSCFFFVELLFFIIMELFPCSFFPFPHLFSQGSLKHLTEKMLVETPQRCITNCPLPRLHNTLSTHSRDSVQVLLVKQKKSQ